MRNASRALALHVEMQRAALIMLTGTAIFAIVLVTAYVGERQQARQDLLMQEMRGSILSAPVLGSPKAEGVRP